VSRREIRGGIRFLRHLEGQGGDTVTLLSAESGYGKSVFGPALTLLPKRITRRDELVPVYIDLGSADPDRPLAELDQVLSRLRRDVEPIGRPLFVLDSLNETVSPESFAAELADRREELQRLHYQLLVLFSFRHHSYPAHLRFSMLEQGFERVESVELLFDVNGEGDLDFLPQLDGGGTLRGLEDLRPKLTAYAARSPLISVSRQDVRRYLTWRRSKGSEQVCPSPADLSVAEILGRQPTSVESIAPLAQVGFLLLGQELTVTSYRHIAERTRLDRSALEVAAAAHPHLPVRCRERYFQVESETAIRVLGALEVGRRLLDGKSPGELGGCTIYDVCAPYVPAVLDWLSRGNGAEVSSDRFQRSIRTSLRGSHAPYSFYATVLCSDSGGALCNRAASLDQHLFEQLIGAIDVDRLQTCSASLRDAGAQEPEILLDPVLDQLFEVMAAYGNRAVALLLEILGNTKPLIRSQAAYLLLDWVRRAIREPSGESERLLESIPKLLPVADGNLHFRFHQVEILESLQGTPLLEQTEAGRRVLWLLAEIEANAGDSIDSIDGYSEFQALISLHARSLTVSMSPVAVAALREQLDRCISLLPTEGCFWESDQTAAVEASLECWEVCLGMAVRMCGLVRQNLAYATFLERSLDHELWIIRWWAFSGILRLVAEAAAAGEGTLARRWAARAVRQLHQGVEPIGVKHQQCALIRRLRDEDGAAALIMREALLGVPPPTPADPERQQLAERYYQAMEASPDAYLDEFFRRLDAIAEGRLSTMG
jgi:hypothetical protein